MAGRVGVGAWMGVEKIEEEDGWDFGWPSGKESKNSPTICLGFAGCIGPG